MPVARSAVLLCLLLLPAATTAQTRVRQPVARGPLAFEENRGQTDSRVRFLARGKGYTLFLTEHDAVFSLGGGDRDGASVRMSLVGARPPSRIAGAEPRSAKSHYFRGPDPRRWTTDVPTYAQVRYEGIYRGIDLVYYGNPEQLEYDFVVAPGADPAAIKVRLTGSDRRHVADNGDLVLRAGGRELRQRRPVAYQDLEGVRRQIPARYVLAADGTVSFRVGAYDRNVPLTIDPVLIYSTYLGGSTEFFGVSVLAADQTGAAYAAGTTTSVDFPTTPGAFRTEPDGDDAFVTKYDATGSVVYSAFLGGHGLDQIHGIAVDRFGAAYVAGWTTASDFPTTPGVFQPACALPCNVGFITKLNPTGSSLVFSTYLGGALPDSSYGTYPASLVVNEALQIFVTGATGPGLPVTAGAYQTAHPGPSTQTGFVTKLNAAGTALIYSTYLGGSINEQPNDIAIDAAGSAYVTGLAQSPDFPTTPGAFQRTCRIGNFDRCFIAFITKFNAAGSSIVYSTFLGGGGAPIDGFNGSSSMGRGIAVDGAGFAYVAGHTYTADFPTTLGSVKTATTTLDAFVTKLNQAGTGLIYSTYVGGDLGDAGAGIEEGEAIAVNADGSAYIVGTTSSHDFPVTQAIQPSFAHGGWDAYVAKLDATGSAFEFASYLGGEGTDHGHALAVDSTGNIYLAGHTNSSGFPIAEAAQPEKPGGSAGFVTKIGEPSCGTDVTGQVQVFRSAIVPFFWPFNLQLVLVWNNSLAPVSGPVAYVMDDLQNALFVGSSKTRCFSPGGDPLMLVPIGGDNVLAPNEAVLMGLLFFQTQLGPISYTPRLLSGNRNY